MPQTGSSEKEKRQKDKERRLISRIFKILQCVKNFIIRGDEECLLFLLLSLFSQRQERNASETEKRDRKTEVIRNARETDRQTDKQKN